MLPLRPDPCPPKTRADLEWDRVLAAVAARCVGPLGRDLALGLPFAPSRDEARDWLAQAAEATGLLIGGRALPAGEVDDVREATERVRVGGVLAPADLRALGRMLGAARALRRFLSSRRADLPRLFDACSTDPTLDAVADEISSAFDADGTLADHASPRLRELRREWHAARQRMLARMEDLMTRYEAVVQDRFVTEREGRWVLPVRSDAHERFPGIVHATSSSGATLFVEPRAVVPMGNRLKVLEADVRREEEAVYARLTALVADSLPSVEAAGRALALADVRRATAALANDLGLVFPDVVDDPRIDLKRARHPLLALEGPVVPSDLSVSAGRAVVVSGPNAGGKTVALKTMGLAALMIRAGMPVACGEGSTVGLLDVVLTDVGDDQSLQKNLSTFSAHVKNLTEVLLETAPGALVLLDELAGGTDPREGEALAAGVLDSLCARGGAVAATTHYEGLKALALADTRFQNASVGFDLATMTPTFELVVGVPGRSSALAVARRYGMPSTVIERASRFLTREDQSFEAVVKRLHDERAALELARRAADEREAQADAVRARLSVELEAAKNREKRVLSEEGAELLDRLRRARDDLRDARARLRVKKVDAQAVREAERSIERVSGEIAIGGPLESLVSNAPSASEPTQPVRPSEMRRGARVWVRLAGWAEAEVVDVLADGTVARRRGAAQARRLQLAELRAVAPREPLPAGPAARGGDPRPVPRRGPHPDRRQHVRPPRSARRRRARDGDVLPRRIRLGAHPVVFLVHGYGTGALRDAIREELARSRYVARFRGGLPDQGGEGVTVVWLA